MASEEVRDVSAFAPGHVTGLFVPDLGSNDPRGRGSRGAGVVLRLGATAQVTWRPAPRRWVDVRDTQGRRLPITEEAVRHLIARQPVALRVRVRHQLPVGQGFGMSAAGTLATSLALARAFDLPRQRAVEVAHLAELFGGGGLGGVPAILGGGLESRTAAGVPPWGRVVHWEVPQQLLIGVVGAPLPSPPLLRQPRFLARVAAAAGNDLLRVDRDHGLDSFLAASERFTERLGLASRPLLRVLGALQARGARAAQAMFGQSFFAFAPNERVRAAALDYLNSARVPAVELGSSRRGAGVLAARARRGRRASEP